jgi:hypothetical protein
MKHIKKLKTMPEIMLYHAKMTWQFRGISGCHTFRSIYGHGIFSTRRPSSSHDAHSPVLIIETGEFTVTTHIGGSVPFISYVKRMVRLILKISIFN